MRGVVDVTASLQWVCRRVDELEARLPDGHQWALLDHARSAPSRVLLPRRAKRVVAHHGSAS
jgi:hypothetical protein